MISVKEIAWVAGILEGEGSFGLTNKRKAPCIWLGMSDADVIERVRSIVDKSLSITIIKNSRKPTYKDQYRITLNGSRAIGWMFTIYQFMSIRRKARIRECIQAWKTAVVDQRYVNSPFSIGKRKLTVRLSQLGYSAIDISIAGQLKDMNFSDEEIIKKLKHLESSGKQ